jgi:hypothetical protein
MTVHRRHVGAIDGVDLSEVEFDPTQECGALGGWNTLPHLVKGRG